MSEESKLPERLVKGKEELDKKLAADLPLDERLVIAEEKFDNLMEENKENIGYVDYHQGHRLRFQKSLEWVSSYLEGNEIILNFGPHCVFEELIEAAWPSVTLSDTDVQDLRYPLEGINDGSVDMVLFMETIEHLSDQTFESIDEILKGDVVLSGVKNAVAEASRVIRSGGKLFLTTPNACSWFAILQMIHHSPYGALTYHGHFREFSYVQLFNLLKDADFKILQFDTVHTFQHDKYVSEKGRILDFLLNYGSDTKHRDDTIFIVAEKK